MTVASGCTAATPPAPGPLAEDLEMIQGSALEEDAARWFGLGRLDNTTSATVTVTSVNVDGVDMLPDILGVGLYDPGSSQRATLGISSDLPDGASLHDPAADGLWEIQPGERVQVVVHAALGPAPHPNRTSGVVVDYEIDTVQYRHAFPWSVLVAPVDLWESEGGLNGLID